MQKAYDGSGNKMHMFNAPVFKALLDRLKYPQSEILLDELTHGFQLIGDIPGGVGWPRRAAPKPDIPLSLEELYSQHNQMLRDTVKSRKPEGGLPCRII